MIGNLITGNWDFVTGNGRYRVPVVNGICIIRSHQVLVALKIPDIKYFMRSPCVPGHCHVRVRTFVMQTDSGTSKIPTYKVPTSNTASLRRTDFPKPTASREMTQKEEAQMRYWARRHGKCVRHRNRNVLEPTLPICKTFGVAIVVGLVERAKIPRRILVRKLMLMNFVMMMMKVTPKVT